MKKYIISTSSFVLFRNITKNYIFSYVNENTFTQSSPSTPLLTFFILVSFLYITYFQFLFITFFVGKYFNTILLRMFT